jgi:hypothetical protein
MTKEDGAGIPEVFFGDNLHHPRTTFTALLQSFRVISLSVARLFEYTPLQLDPIRRNEPVHVRQ